MRSFQQKTTDQLDILWWTTALAGESGVCDLVDRHYLRQRGAKMTIDIFVELQHCKLKWGKLQLPESFQCEEHFPCTIRHNSDHLHV